MKGTLTASPPPLLTPPTWCPPQGRVRLEEEWPRLEPKALAWAWLRGPGFKSIPETTPKQAHTHLGCRCMGKSPPQDPLSSAAELYWSAGGHSVWH